jgi:hypothetical protein
LVVTHAIDGNEVGGFKLLVRQMMDAIGKRFAVHEIVWKPSPEGLTAELRFVPLWFFENTTGKLRFLKQPYGLEGVELQEGAWMVCSLTAPRLNAKRSRRATEKTELRGTKPGPEFPIAAESPACGEVKPSLPI